MNLPFAKFAAAALCLLATGIKSQNVVVSGANIGNGTYATLGASFTAINSGSQSGATISISIVGNTTEASSANLNAGAWNSITITPAGARTITATTGLELFDFNGADRVTVNGLNSGGNSLTFDNTNGGAVMWFENDACNNTLRNLTIRSSNSYAPVVFWTATVTGNDSITVDSCIIRPSSAGGNCWNGIYSGGTFGMENSDITISNCQISDYHTSSWHNGGIHLFTGNTRWTIINNRLFQTVSRSFPNGYNHYGIDISSGNGYIISGNTIGYASSFGTGVYTITGSNPIFGAIVASLDPGTVSTIDGNVINAINMSITNGTSTFIGTLCGIYVSGADANIGVNSPNIIGSSFINTVSLTATTLTGTLNAIKVTGNAVFNIQNNIIGGLTTENSTSTNGAILYGIDASGVSGSFTISNNTIGGGNIDDLRAGTISFTSGQSVAMGINISSVQSANSVITGNTIRNIACYGLNASTLVAGISTGTTSSNASALTISGNTIHDIKTNSSRTGFSSGWCSVTGIKLSTGTYSQITDNTIYNITNINTGNINTVVAGITHSDGSNLTMARNNIYDVLNSGGATSSTLPSIAAGIIIRSGDSEMRIQNNTISLGSSTSGNACYIGIMMNHAVIPNPTLDRIYHNSVNIAGSSTGNQPSYCFMRGDLSNTARVISVDVRNNVFTNTRSGGTGVHYAIANNPNAAGNATGWGAGASNNNVLNTTAAGVGYWGGQRTFAQWQTTSSCDAQSLSGITVTYVNAANDLHMVVGSNPLIEQAGLPLPGVTDDFDSDPRSICFVDLGADEFSDPREIAVTGNALGISDGDVSASFTDHTMFDSTSVCNGTTSRTFTIQNTGIYPLSISGVTITGANAGDFTLTTPPAGTITGSGSTTFTIEFNPSASGIRNAVVNIASNDCDEATYDFAIAGTGSQITLTSITSTMVSCFGGNDGSATANISGGIAPITFVWSSGGNAATETNLIAGSYAITVTDANGCTAMGTVTVTEPAQLQVVSIVYANDTTCSGDDGSIDLTVIGGTPPYNYSWSNLATTEDLSGLGAGVYTCTVTDMNGCTILGGPITINGPTAPSVTYVEAIDTACQTTTNPFALNAGSPTGGTWSGPGVSGNMFDPMNANIGWNVIVYSYTDSATGCSATASDSIWVDLCMGIEPVPNAGIQVFPNPTSTLLIIRFGNDLPGKTIELAGVDGKIVYRSMNNSGSVTIDMTEFSDGTYILTVFESEMPVHVVKVIKADE